ncbi:MAG: SpoIIE family protein phosphatase [Myxococcota bacterium]|nr:SpoIIE family protein phosphatase [Myxococcota bacterium]
MEVAFASQALRESEYCGDQVGFWICDSLATLCVADGLGHGPHAEHAAKEIMGYVGHNLGAPSQAIFSGADQAARQTRGAAVGLVLADLQGQTLTYAAVGNTRVFLLERADRSPKDFQNTNGIVGAGYQKLQVETVSFQPGDLLFLYTDGFPARADLASLRSRERHPKEIAAEFLERFALGTDDAAVLVARLGALG